MILVVCNVELFYNEMYYWKNVYSMCKNINKYILMINKNEYILFYFIVKKRK